MKKVLFVIVFCVLCISFNVKAKEYKETEIKECLKSRVLMCDLNEHPLNGIVKEYYKSGNIEAEISYKDGKKNGIEKIYYENGQIQMEIFYKDSYLGHITEGVAKIYNKNGKLRVEIPYLYGEVNYTSVICYDKNGNPL